MPRGLIGRIIVSFGLAILCFCGSTLYSQSISRHIDDAALSIATNAMPSIEELAETRGNLRRLDVATNRYLIQRNDDNRNNVVNARRDADAAFERYLAQPDTYPGEQALWGKLHAAFHEVDASIDQVLDDPKVDVIAAGNRVTTGINAAATAIRSLIDFNADNARRDAQRITNDHRRATDVAILLDVLSTIFTLIAGWMALRALRHYHRIAAERNDLLQRRAQELEMFAGRVAHDILGPLSATRLAVDHAASQVDNAAVERTLARGRRGVERVTTIVDGLLRFARAGARPEAGAITSVLPVVSGVVTDLGPEAQTANIALALLPSPPSAVHAHAGVLASVVENLVRNAIKYMGDRPVRRIDVETILHDRFVRLEVRDTGPGIAPAYVDNIFDPHVRGRTAGQPGIGLGLATVKRVAESHGGKVGLKTRLDEGTTFWVELPRADYEDDSREKRASAQAGK
jgi:signal transduction histidine kinase